MADNDRRDGNGVSPKLVVFGILAVLLVWFMLINTESVTVAWIFGTSEIPLIWVIIGAAFLGALIGWIFSLARRGND